MVVNKIINKNHRTGTYETDKSDTLNDKIIFLYLLLLFLFSISGLLVSAYLFNHHHVKNNSTLCTINQVFDCNKIDTSEYSELFGIPVSLLGIIFYSLLLILLVIEILLMGLGASNHEENICDKRSLIGHIINYYLLVGFLFGLYLTLVEALIIKSFCIFCLFSFSMTIVLLITHHLFLKVVSKIR